MDCNNYNGRIFIPKQTATEASKVEVSGTAPIKVTKEIRGDSTVYIVKYAPYSSPTVTLTANPSFLEVGQSTLITFNGTTIKGSEEIKDRVITPTTSFTLNGNDLSFTATCGSSTTGIKNTHSLKVIDMSNKEVSISTGVLVKHRYFIGTIPRGTVTFLAADSGRLGTSITDSYGGFNTYSIPEGESHIAWLVPAGEGSSIPTPKSLNGTTWKLTSYGQTTLVNTHGLSVTYDIMGTINYYNGVNTIDLTL
jgi:hypothetical protein